MQDALNDHTVDPVEGELNSFNTILGSDNNKLSDSLSQQNIIGSRTITIPPSIPPEFNHPEINVETYLTSDIFIFIAIVFFLMCFFWPLIWWYQYQKLKIDEASIRDYLKDAKIQNV